MFKHYLTIALRSFNRFRLATLINVLCLALGLACLVVTYAVITFISKSDAHFANASRVQVITEDLNAPAVGARFDHIPFTGPVIARLVETDFPQLEAVARRTQEYRVPVSTGDSATFATISYADPKFLDIFRFSFVSGAGSSALREPRSVVLTEKAAQRIFSTRDVVGRTLRISNRENVTVAGVIAAIAEPTRFGFEILGSMDIHEALGGHAQSASAGDFGQWMWLQDNYFTYALLPVDGSLAAADFASQLKDFSRRHIPRHEGGNTIELGIVPLGEVFINSMNAALGSFARTGISIAALGYMLAGLVLIIACLNYANLATALASIRAKEVGLRKVIGAGRGQVLVQHLFEAALIGFTALLLTLLLVTLMIPLVKRVGFDITASVLLQPAFGGFLALLLLVVTIAGGAYPALVLSSIRPTQALRMGVVRAGRRFVPSLLVIIQFAASSFLLIAVLIMHAQNGVILKLGNTLAGDPAVVISSSLKVAGIDAQVLRTRLVDSTGLIKSVTSTSAIPMSQTENPLPMSRTPEANARPITVAINNVSYDFFSTLGIPLLAGRDFSPQHADDGSMPWEPSQPPNIIVDGRFARQMGWTAEDAVGKTAYFPYGKQSFPMRIVGVVGEKPLQLLSLNAGSSVYFLSEPAAVYPVIRISRSDIPAALARIDKTWKELSPNVPLQRRFLDEFFEQSYQILQRISLLITSLAAFGCGIAAIGLLGMAVYVIERRTHEIGVRKTLGAHTRQIVVLLLKDFSKPIIVANLITWPLAFIAGGFYLRLFAEHTTHTPLPFAIGLAITLLIAWLAVGNRVLRAANLKPAEVLRYE